MECENGGNCHEGACVCPKWYSGENCQLFYNRNYEGIYTSTDPHSSTESKLVLTADAKEPNRLWAEEGYYLDFQTDSTLVIPEQSLVMDADTFEISGLGEYSMDHISLRFSEVLDPDALTSSPVRWLYKFTGDKEPLK